MSVQPAVLQVVILRDGLLVGTEVFVPGQYTLGSADGVDLKLDDPSVAPSHAFLYFQNGRAAIQDAGNCGVYVNGHRVNACEVRSVDEISCGPFVLKVRVLEKKPAAQAPPPEVAALIGEAPRAAATTSKPSSTVVSWRMSAAPAPAAPPAARGAPHLRAVENLDSEPLTEGMLRPELAVHPPPPTKAERSSARPIPSPEPPRPRPVVTAPPSAAAAPPPRPDRARPQKKPGRRPSIPSHLEGKGSPRLFVEVFWGELRQSAKSFGKIDPKKKLLAAESDGAELPLYGYNLGGKDFVFAEQKGDLYRVYIPPKAAVERRAQDGNFYPVATETLEVAPNQARCITMGTGHALRLSGEGDHTLVAYVQPPLRRPFANPLRGLPWLTLFFLAVFGGAFGAFVFMYVGPLSAPDFSGRRLQQVAVRLVAPPKKEEKKKLEEKIEKLKKKEEKKPKKEEKKVEKEVAKVAPETKKVLKSIEKLTAAGPAMKDLLAAVDKLGSGPGSKNAKNDFKLSGLLGKAPIANAGIGTFGLGGGGGGGMGIKGAELLRGKGGGGIGALGSGRVGKGSVAGTVTHAVARSVGAQGSIDKEAVAKVINSHLHEVTSCYERALLKEPGLAGKIILEWQITLAGTVGFAKTKSSTMRSSAVEGCILSSLKLWKFPPAKGAGVIITYPFMFNSVGY